MYRRSGTNLEVLLVYPGGPLWRNKDDGARSIPKGEMAEDEDAEVAAHRQFVEETGCALLGLLEPLGDIRRRGGKRVTAFAVEGDLDPVAVKKAIPSRWNGRRKPEGYRSRDRSRGLVRPGGRTREITRKPTRLSELVLREAKAS